MDSGSEYAPEQDSYNAVAKVLHWLIAGAIVLQFVLANMAENSESKFRELVLTANHKSVGITILVLVIVRLAWRLRGRPEPLPMPQWQRVASAISHWGFYVLLIVLPVSGWLMSSASNISVSWFNLFQLPDFVAPNESTEALFHGMHETLAKLLFVLALVHVGAALKHSFIDRDGILRRISSPAALISFAVVILAGVLMLVPESRASGHTDLETGAEGALPEWQIDYEASTIQFTAEQAGAEFVGTWRQWNAELRFDAEHLDASSFHVAVSVMGVDTQDRERDETLMDGEFFDGVNYPLVFFRSSTFAANPDGSFVAAGQIEVKGNSTPVELTFTVERTGENVVLDGSATLDRLVLEVGTGEWEDTAWIGQYVDVAVHVEARTE